MGFRYVGSREERIRKYTAEVASIQFNILVTTYEFIMRDRARLSKVPSCSENRTEENGSPCGVHEALMVCVNGPCFLWPRMLLLSCHAS